MEKRTVLLLEKLVMSGIQLLCNASSPKKLKVGALGPFIALTGQIHEGLIIVPDDEFLLGYEFVPVKSDTCLNSMKYEGGISFIYVEHEDARTISKYELHSSKNTMSKIPLEIYLETIPFEVYQEIKKKNVSL